MVCNHNKQHCSAATVCLGRRLLQHTPSLQAKSNQEGKLDAAARGAQCSQTDTNHVSAPITLLPKLTVFNITAEE